VEFPAEVRVAVYILFLARKTENFLYLLQIFFRYLRYGQPQGQRLE
jgi:uncharacterized membrane protein